MYNRYIPQPDGSYQKKYIPDPMPAPPRPCPPPPPPRPEPDRQPEKPPRPQRREPPRQQPCSADSFLKNLLPRDLDTGDLLVIVLLLLMSGDAHGDGNNALLTLALYLFL